jgi:SAM-dependent methyltransferase
LEIGAGSTNSTAYALAARTPVRHVYVHEPFVALQADLDARLLEQSAATAGVSPELVRSKVARITDTSALPGASIDLIVSHSVLEHVSDPAQLFRESARLLNPEGAMLHIVDYRDHFFKYPYHFLQFSRGSWQHLLDPGDLPRWRLSDHLKLLRDSGFAVTVQESTRDEAAFDQLRPYLSPDFDASDPNLSVQTAVIFATRHADPAR